MCFQSWAWQEARKWSDSGILSTTVYSHVQLLQPVDELRNPVGVLNMSCKNFYSYVPHWVLKKRGHRLKRIVWNFPSITRIKHGQMIEDLASLDVDTMPKISYMELRSLIWVVCHLLLYKTQCHVHRWAGSETMKEQEAVLGWDDRKSNLKIGSKLVVKYWWKK